MAIQYQSVPTPVVHALVFHTPSVKSGVNRKPGVYRDVEARKAYNREWTRKRRAALKPRRHVQD
jgi:hypothetical protein